MRNSFHYTFCGLTLALLLLTACSAGSRKYIIYGQEVPFEKSLEHEDNVKLMENYEKCPKLDKAGLVTLKEKYEKFLSQTVKHFGAEERDEYERTWGKYFFQTASKTYDILMTQFLPGEKRQSYTLTLESDKPLVKSSDKTIKTMRRQLLNLEQKASAFLRIDDVYYARRLIYDLKLNRHVLLQLKGKYEQSKSSSLKKDLPKCEEAIAKTSRAIEILEYRVYFFHRNDHVDDILSQI